MTFSFSAAGPDGQARRAALDALGQIAVTPTSLVEYRSTGRLLILGPWDRTVAVLPRLGRHLSCTVVVSENPDPAPDGAQWLLGEPRSLAGFMGSFTLSLGTADGLKEAGPYDLILDLGDTPLLDRELPPPGCFNPGADPQALEQALAELPELTGAFEKPRFFDYDPDICAHGRSGMSGCTRCLDACPTLAITSLGERIDVDPYLCQGAGGCVAACPTGAIRYVYPPAADTATQLRHLLKTYRDAGGGNACVLFHDAEAGRERLARVAPQLPENVLPLELAELGSTGPELWLSALAYGAARLAWLDTPQVPGKVRRALDSQLATTRAILAGMGDEAARLQRLPADDDPAVLDVLQQPVPEPHWPPAGFAAYNDKRQTQRLAVDYLYKHAPAPREQTTLPPGSPFGRIHVDQDACTLCMGCASVCPTHAVSAGGDRPRLDFTEGLCVQCGLCEQACPEDAITLETRFIYDPEQRRRRQVLNEEAPFLCLDCGKPFATASLIRRMTDKLAGHRMFQNPRARRRLMLCEDCRIRDMFADESAPAPRLEPEDRP